MVSVEVALTKIACNVLILVLKKHVLLVLLAIILILPINVQSALKEPILLTIMTRLKDVDVRIFNFPINFIY